MVDKSEVFRELDARRGQDFINAVHEISMLFGLSHREFYEIFIEWRG